MIFFVIGTKEMELHKTASHINLRRLTPDYNHLTGEGPRPTKQVGKLSFQKSRKGLMLSRDGHRPCRDEEAVALACRKFVRAAKLSSSGGSVEVELVRYRNRVRGDVLFTAPAEGKVGVLCVSRENAAGGDIVALDSVDKDAYEIVVTLEESDLLIMDSRQTVHLAPILPLDANFDALVDLMTFRCTDGLPSRFL